MPEDRTDASTSAPAGAWPRYWARSLDLLLWAAVCGVVLGMLAPQLFATSGGPSARDDAVGLLFFPVVMAIDTVVLAIFRTTPGKWLCGIRLVSTGGQRISLAQYLSRDFRIYFFGLALGIPLIALFTLYRNYQKVSAGNLTSWDRELETDVVRVHASTWRTTLTAAIYFLFASALIGLGVWGASVLEQTPEQLLREGVEELNKSAPKMLDAATRLDGAEVNPGLVLQYNYTLTAVSGDAAARAAENLRLQRAIRPGLLQSFCGSDMQSLRGMGGGLRYRYSDKDGQLIGLIEVSRRDCASSAQ